MTIRMASARSRKLILFGGGPRPLMAMRRFVEWSALACARADSATTATGEPSKLAPRILVVAWSSLEPRLTVDSLASDFSRLGAKTHASLEPPSCARDTREFLALLACADGVYFTGGDQNRVADALAAEPVVRSALAERYRSGIAFGGTSAGTAIMSPTMIGGDAEWPEIVPPLRAGLGLLPRVLIDQHFSQRSRHGRLLAALGALTGSDPSRAPVIGLGIDEDAALAVIDDRFAEVIGTGQVMVALPEHKPELLGPGARLELCDEVLLAKPANGVIRPRETSAGG